MLVSGPGSASTLAYAQELTAQAAQLHALASASQTNAAGTYGSGWSGVGATGSQAAHAGVNTQLAALAAWVQARAPFVTAAAQAYNTAVSTMVPTYQACANRAQEAADVEVNPRVLGALTPQIAELNLDYFGHMWPTNASAGTSYGAALNSATAALAAPPPPATPAASPEAPATAAKAVADAEVRTAAGAGMRQAYGSVSAASAVTQHGSGMSQAMVPPQTPPPAPSAPPTKFAELRPPVASTPSAPSPAMYAQPPSNAAVYGPPAPAAAPGAPAEMRPGMPGVPVTPPAGVTSFIRPSAPFAMPAMPNVAPGILNSSSVYAAAVANATSAIPVQPPVPPRPATPLTPIHDLNPPPAPAVSSPTAPAPAGPPAPSAQPNTASPPSTKPPEPPAPAPEAGGAQMYGLGPGFTPTPLAPRFPPITEPPVPPPPPIEEMTREQALAAWDALRSEIADHNAACPAIVPTQAQADRCNAWRDELLARQAALEARLGNLGVQILPRGTEPQPNAPQPPSQGETEETPPTAPPTRITGQTEHGEQQAQSRDGHGVAESAMSDAVTNPIEPPLLQSNGTYKFVGRDAVVVLNPEGKVVTTWARNSNGWRNP